MLDAELYQTAPTILETETEIERYLQERSPRDTDIYAF